MIGIISVSGEAHLRNIPNSFKFFSNLNILSSRISCFLKAKVTTSWGSLPSRQLLAVTSHIRLVVLKDMLEKENAVGDKLGRKEKENNIAF